jgi:hypothetical protein
VVSFNTSPRNHSPFSAQLLWLERCDYGAPLKRRHYSGRQRSLKSAQLQADRNQPTEATRLFAEILAVEPDWPDALDAQFWFLVTQGDHAFYHTTLAGAGGYFQAAETVIQRLLKAEPDAPRAPNATCR